MVKARKNFLTMTVAIVGALILIGVFSAQAATVRLDPQDPNNANGIDNLVFEG